MKTVFAYIRVSTTKQGQEGASLPEQKSSIEAYCKRNGLHIVRWFEEQETAAKKGRKLFTEMMRLVKRRRADGLVFHKIDRSSRNLADWAEVSSLPEQGIDVHYSHEPVDLKSTHGRTAADVAAVFAASYIRNLREEVKKGIQGRLKQGIYPFGAPVGYLNMGGGKLKEIDPEKGPLVRKLFERYATGEYSLRDMVEMSKSLGLTSMLGQPLKLTSIAAILHNSFYTGLITMKGNGETFEGGHKPLITMALYRRAQDVMTGRVMPRKTRERYLFQKMLACNECGYSLIAERQKGNLYYRCHKCRGVCIRESSVEQQLERELSSFDFSDAEKQALRDDISKLISSMDDERRAMSRSLRLQKDNINARIERLTDTFLDGSLSKDEYESRKAKLLADRLEIASREEAISNGETLRLGQLEKKVEPIFALQHQYFAGNEDEKRGLLKILTSNLLVSQKSVIPQWKSPFYELKNSKSSIQVLTVEAKLEFDADKSYHTNPDLSWTKVFAKALIKYWMTEGDDLLPFLPKLPRAPLFVKRQ